MIPFFKLFELTFKLKVYKKKYRFLASVFKKKQPTPSASLLCELWWLISSFKFMVGVLQRLDISWA